MVYLITGKSNAGKTTEAYRLAKNLRKHGHCVYVLDADRVRKEFKDKDFTNSGRKNHIMKMAKFAAIAEEQGITVIIACLSPKRKWREEARKHFKQSELIYMKGGKLWKGTKYEEPIPEEFS